MFIGKYYKAPKPQPKLRINIDGFVKSSKTVIAIPHLLQIQLFAIAPTIRKKWMRDPRNDGMLQ